MAEFCENCPMRGTAEGRLTIILEGELKYRTWGGEGYKGPAGMLVAENLGASEPIQLPSSDEMQERLYTRVDECSEPETRERGIIRKRVVPVRCPAIGYLAIEQPQVKKMLREHAARELVR